MYEKSTLDNGLRLVTHSMRHMESAVIGLWVGTGGRYEVKSNKGIAHLLEHLSFKGTRKYSLKCIKESVEGLGGSLNAFTSEEFTCYLVKIIGRHLPLAVDILSDMVLEPLLLKKDLEKEKSVILEEIKMYRDLPQSYVGELLDTLLWPGHPLGMSLAGTLESVSMLKVSDVVDFHGKFYQPANTVCAVSGNIEHEVVLRQLSGLFLKAKSKPAIVAKKVSTAKNGIKTNFFYKDTEQSHLAIGYHSPGRDHPDRHVVGLLHIMLGANMSSRLFHEVREKKGLAYEIGTHVRYFRDTGAFVIHAGVDNHKVSSAISVIIKEMRRISNRLVTKEEFSRAKEYYTGQLLMALEDTLDHMLWIGEQEIALNRIKSMQEALDEINKVNIDDCLRVAGSIFRKNRLNVAVIGPHVCKEQAAIERIFQG